MDKVLSVAAGVSTPLGFLGLVAAITFFVYSRRVKREERRLEALPPEQRAAFEEELLVKLGIDGTTLTRAQKFEIIRDELRRRFQLRMGLAVLSAVVFVVCFAIAVFGASRNGGDGGGSSGGGGTKTEPPKEVRLAVALTRSNLTETGGTAIAVPAGPFRGADLLAAADAAASWVHDALAAKYPRAAAEPLEVRAKIRVDPTGSNHDVQLEPTDGLRTDRFWVLGTADFGKSHHLVGDAREVSREAITKARDAAKQAQAPGGPPVDHLCLHCDRPGYRLALLEVPIDGREVKGSMPRRDPAFTVVVLGGKEKRERDAVRDLVARLQAAGIDAGDESFQKVRRGKYEESRKVGITPAQRFTALIESRIDAFVTVTEYSE